MLLSCNDSIIVHVPACMPGAERRADLPVARFAVKALATIDASQAAMERRFPRENAATRKNQKCFTGTGPLTGPAAVRGTNTIDCKSPNSAPGANAL